MKHTDPFVERLQEVANAFMTHSMRKVIKYSKKSGYSMSHLGALMHLNNKGVSAVSKIGDHLGITNPAVSQMLDRLVDEKLIQRTEDPSDRRSKKIVLTKKGMETLHESIKARQTPLVELAERLSESEKEQISAAFDILLENLKMPDFQDTKNSDSKVKNQEINE